jgi:hypothetical protein
MASKSDLHEPRTNAEQSETAPNLRVSFESDPVVYFVGDQVGPIKIGFSTDVWERFRRLRNSMPGELRMLAARSGSKALEREYHQRFHAWRLHGEWFERTPELLAEIDRVNRGDHLFEETHPPNTLEEDH